jgi:hypothetical protein
MNERKSTHELVGLDGKTGSFRTFSKEEIQAEIPVLDGVNPETALPFVNKQGEDKRFILQKYPDGQIRVAMLI